MPFSFEEAQAVGLAALHQGEARRRGALHAGGRAALDPRNAVIKRNLGIIHARAGDALRSSACSRAPTGTTPRGSPARRCSRRSSTPRRCSRTGSRRCASRTRAPRRPPTGACSASPRGTRRTTTSRRTVREDRRGRRRRPGDLARVRDDARQPRALARRRADRAPADHRGRRGPDVSIVRGPHALARALCGQGRFAEAMGPAEEAARTNPLPDNAAEFADTLSRVRATSARRPRSRAPRTPSSARRGARSPPAT